MEAVGLEAVRIKPDWLTEGHSSNFLQLDENSQQPISQNQTENTREM